MQNFLPGIELELPGITLPSLPIGWKVEKFSNSGGSFERAVCPDGFVHYAEGDKWLLNVPWFRSSRPGLKEDDLAICEHVTGNDARPISSKGIITLPSRKVGPREWNH